MLVILSKENKHKHGGYLSLANGIGFTSPEGKDKHEHVIRQDPPVLDEQGNIAQEGQWFVEAAGKDPHVHEIEDLIRTSPVTKKIDEETRVAEVMSLVKEASSNEGGSIKKGKVCYGFYDGDGHWDKNGKAALESNGRSAITVDEIQPRVDILCGTHDQNKVDIVFRPVENGDSQSSDIANMIFKSIMNKNSFHREEGYVFKDLTVTGRGVKTVELDFDDNVEGEIKVRWYPWDKILFGPHERPDQEDLEYMIKFDNFSMGKLKQLFPKKAKDIDYTFQNFDITNNEYSEAHDNVAGKAYRNSNITELVVNGEPIVDVARKEFKVYELWQKEFRNIKGLVFSDDNFVDNGDDIKDADMKMLKRITGMRAFNRKVCDIRKTEMAGGMIFSDEVLDLPANANVFHSIACYAKKHKHKFHGKVEPVIGLQQVINKLTSQTMDITNKVAAYGWFYDNQTFDTPDDADHFKKNSSSAGFLQKVADAARPPVQAQGVKFPSELVNLGQVASQKLDSIFGVPPKASDYSGDLTAKLHMLSKRQSLVGNDFLFENANMANMRMARLVMAYVQDIYTVERIRRIISSQTQQDIDDLEDPNVINVSDEEIQFMLDNEKLLSLDLVMSESSHTDTMRELAFMSFQEVMQTVGGDPTILRQWIENSPFPNRKKILEQMGEQQQAASEASTNTNDSQNFASMPPAVKEQLAMQGIFSYKDLNESRAMKAQQQEQQAIQ